MDKNVHAYVYECIRTVYAAFLVDHPEVFWINGYRPAYYILDGKYHYGLVLSLSSGTSDVSDMRLPEFRPGGGLDVREVMARRDADVEKILRTIPAGADRFTQVYYLNKWLTENNEYNTIVSNPNWDGKLDSWSAFQCVGPLAGTENVNGPVCEGYSLAFKLLCDRLGIPCVYVNGVRRNNGTAAHVWNYVQMEDGKWYAVDVTRNDTNGIYDGKILGKLSGRENLNYFLIGGKTVVKGKEYRVSYPVLNYCYRGGLYFPNGPALNDTAYPRGVHLAYDGLPETLSPGDSVSMTPVLICGSDTSYTYSSTALPAGLTLDPKTGRITGRITDGASARAVTVTAAGSTDAASCTLRFPAAAYAPAFTDVPDWCAGAANWAAGQNIAQGYGDGIFGAGDLCTEVQILTFLWRAAGRPGAAASPVTVAEEYQGAADWAYGKGMIGGGFDPDAPCTRSGAVTYIWRAFGSPAAAGSGFTDVPAGAGYAAAVS